MPRTEAESGKDLMLELLRKLDIDSKEAVDRMASLITVQDPNNVIGQMRSAIHAGKLPMIVVNHQSLADGPALTAITSQLDKRFNLPVAASIDGGLQGNLIQIVNSYLYPVMAQRNLVSIPIISKGDVDKRNMAKGSTGLFTLMKTVRNGYGFAMFPEGTVQGGRSNAEGVINGLVTPSNPTAFTQMVMKFKEQGADPVVLPVGIDGSYKIFDPVENTFPNDILRMLIGYDKPRKIATITLGDLIPFSEVAVSGGSDDFFMEHIARLLPEPARGAYPLTSL